MTHTFVSFDTETHRIQEGLLAPPLVCGTVSSATVSDDGAIVKAPGELLLKREAIERARQILTDESVAMVGANLAFDFGVLACERSELLRLIFDALAAGRVHDVLVCQALDAIGRGFLTDPLTDPHDGGILRNEYGKPAKRHSLWTCTYILQDRTDAKLNDFWRERYALLEGVPVEDWPAEARQYPIDDVDNALENALRQLGLRGEEWMACNLSDLAAQVETAFCLHLGAIRGIRVCGERLAALKEPLEKWHEEYVAKFQAKGLLQPAALANGSRNPDAGKKSLAAVRRAVAEAYGATGTCAACGGKGRRRTVKVEDCRGVKFKGRFRGCGGSACAACSGSGKVSKPGNEVTCEDCQGTALDLSTSSVIPHTDKDGISTDRDALMESGDDDLSEFAENQASKIRETYVPFLELGVNGPLTLSPNVLVASGRTSYMGLIQLIPRKGFDVKDESGRVVKQHGVRDCFKAREGYYFCSVDYSALELCTLAQVCLWVCGYSEMARVINESGKPGKLHIAFAAKMANVPVEEMEARYKAGDKLAQAFRQASKPCFHPDTEILTRGRGWVKLSELTMQDEVASATPERVGGVRIEWAHPLQLTRRRAPDGLIHFQSSRLNLRVTPNHRMLVLNGYNEFATVEASDVRATHGWHNAGRCRQGGRRAHAQLLREAVAIQFQGENTQGKTVKDICVAAGALNEDGTIPWWWLDLDHDLRWVVCNELGWHTRTCGATCSRASADVFQALLSITNRKAFIVSPTLADPERAPDRVSLNVSQQDCTSSYDYMLDIDELAYDGDVYCLSVPSSYVLVRDKGVPVVVGQCNFGLGGGMGALTFVLTNRLENAGDTTAPNGRKYAGIRFCILIDGAQECGAKKVTQWGRPGRERPCPPTCERCLEIVEYQLRPAWFEQWPEVEEYHAWVKQQLDRTGGMVPCFGPWAAEGLHDWESRAHRVRGGIDRFSAAANNCVDFETEALTKRGWVRGPDLRMDDEILTKNADTGHLEWQRPNAINLYPEYDGPLVEFDMKALSAVTTPDHRWLVFDKKSKEDKCVTTITLDKYGHQTIHRTGYYSGSNAAYSDEFIELVGWFLTDGSKDAHTRIHIYQTKKKNVKRIDALFQRLGIGHNRKVRHSGNVVWSFSDKPIRKRDKFMGKFARSPSGPGNKAKYTFDDYKRAGIGEVLDERVAQKFKVSIAAVRNMRKKYGVAPCPKQRPDGKGLALQLRKLFPERLLTFEFVSQLSRRQARLLVEVMVLGDGTMSRRSTQTVFYTRSEKAVDAFQFLLMLAGMASNARWRDMSKYNPTSTKLKNKPKGTGIWTVRLYSRTHSQIVKSQVRYFQEARGVWCPSVPNTYFVARRKNTVYVTGNSFQALASDGGKLALRRVTRECHLDESSPLYGTRPIMFVHDEIFSETPIVRAHEAACRKSEIMTKAMREWTPDVISVAEPALMGYWYKSAEPVYDSNGRLIPWRPKEKKS